MNRPVPYFSVDVCESVVDLRLEDVLRRSPGAGYPRFIRCGDPEGVMGDYRLAEDNTEYNVPSLGYELIAWVCSPEHARKQRLDAAVRDTELRSSQMKLWLKGRRYGRPYWHYTAAPALPSAARRSGRHDGGRPVQSGNAIPERSCGLSQAAVPDAPGSAGGD